MTTTTTKAPSPKQVVSLFKMLGNQIEIEIVKSFEVL